MVTDTRNFSGRIRTFEGWCWVTHLIIWNAAPGMCGYVSTHVGCVNKGKVGQRRGRKDRGRSISRLLSIAPAFAWS